MPKKTVPATLVLGILGVSILYPVAPIAWYRGRRELRDIAAGRGAHLDRGDVKAGTIMGVVGTLILCFCVLSSAVLWLIVKLGWAALPKIQIVWP